MASDVISQTDEPRQALAPPPARPQSAFHVCAPRFGARASRSSRSALRSRYGAALRVHIGGLVACAAGSSAPALARRYEQLFASPPVTSDVISKTGEPKQLRQARHRHRPRTSSARRTSLSSSVEHVIVNGPRRHQQDEPNQLRQADHRQWPRTSSPRRTSCSSSGKRAIANGLGRHHHLWPRTSSPRRTSRNSPGKRVNANGLGRHQQDGRAAAAKAIAPRRLRQARHRQRPRTSSARRTRRSS